MAPALMGPRGWLVAYLVVAVGQVLGELLGLGLLARVGLVAAMPVLAGLVVASGLPRRRVGRLLLLGLALSWLGDVLGALILVKIGLFLGAQLAYLAAFWPYRRRAVRHPAALLGYAGAVAALVVTIGRDAGTLAPAVVVYGSALGAMALLATGLGRVAGVGGAVFAVSDALIGFDVFVAAPIPGVDPAIMATYLTAQLLLVLGLRRAPGSPGG